MENSVLVSLIIAGMRLASVAIDWLMTYAIHSTLLIGAVWCVLATPSGRRLASSSTAWLWRLALVGGVLSATLQSLRSPDPLGGTVRVGAGSAARTIVRMELERTESTGRYGEPSLIALREAGGMAWRGTMGGDTRITLTSVDTKPKWLLLVVGAWLLGAALFAGLYLRARRRFFRMLGHRRDGRFTLAGGALRGVLDRSHRTRRVDLTIAECLTSPVAMGSREICIPSRVLAELDPIRMESILAHELAHLERRDPTWLTVARVIEAVLFFQPLNRLARARMQEAAEFASDGWAAGVVARPLDLAHCLARVAEWSAGSSRLLAPAMAERRGTVLVRRVRRLTSDAPLGEPPGGRGLRLAGAVAVLALVLLAPRAAVGSGAAQPQRGQGVFLTRIPVAGTGQEGSASLNVDMRIVRLSTHP